MSAQQSPETTVAKLQAAGFDVRRIDGHNPTAIHQALIDHTAHAQDPAAKPFAIVTKTVKGWGFDSVVGYDFHGKPVPAEKKAEAFAALDNIAHEVGAAWSEGDLQLPLMSGQAPQRPHSVRALPTFREALRRLGQEHTLEKGKLATRKAYGIALQ